MSGEAKLIAWLLRTKALLLMAVGRTMLTVPRSSRCWGARRSCWVAAPEPLGRDRMAWLRPRRLPMGVAIALAAVLAAPTAPAAARVEARHAAMLRVHDAPSLLRAVERARTDPRIRRIELAGGRYELATPLRLDERLSGTDAEPFVLSAAPARGRC